MLYWLGGEGDRLRAAFADVFGAHVRPFGTRSTRAGGLSDGNEGTQWNAGYNPDTGAHWIGVNLEGMQYDDWPIARLIERELRTPTLPALARQERDAGPVCLRWMRDHWQVSSRPPIHEKRIAPTPILLGELTEDVWRQALEGAQACLNPHRNRRGRAVQRVTLTRSRQVREGEVTPHLTIGITSRGPTDWPSFLADGKARLQPFYNWTVARSSISPQGVESASRYGSCRNS